MADFTEEQLKAAARQALADGNAVSAQRLIAEARRVGSASAPVTTGPRVIYESGETRVFERPDGYRYLTSPGYSTSDPERIAQALEGASAGDISKRSIDEGLIEENTGAARAGEFVRGSVLGSFADEALGAVRGPNAQQGMRMLSGAMQRQRPGETLGLNLAGGLTEAGLLAAAAPAQVAAGVGSVLGQGTRLSQVGRGALAGSAVGGASGALYGAGEGTDAESRVSEAQRGAALGATFGGLLGGATPIAREVAGNVMSRFRQSDVRDIARELNISQDAATVIRNAFDEGGDMNAAIANLQRAGSEGMLADAGPAAQALLDLSAQSGGQAGQVVRSAIDDRMTRTGRALDANLDTTLGPAPAGPQSAVNAIAERTRPQRAAAYDLAYNTPINYADDAGRRIESVLDRIEPNVLLKAVSEANEDMRARGLTNMQIMASIGDDGKVVYREMPNVQQLDEIKKALQGVAYDNTDDFGRLNGRGQRYNNLARELRDATGDAVEPYRAAVSIGGDNIQEQRAFTLGRNLLRANTEVEDVMLEFGDNPSQAQVDAAKSGLRSYIDKALGDVRAIASDPGADAMEARQVIRAVTDMSSGNARAKIRELMGAEADALLAQVDEAAQSATVRAAVAQNSKTFGRQAGARTVEELAAPGIVGQAAQGEAVNTTKALVQAITGQTSQYNAQRRQEIYQDIARALTQKRGPEAQAALGVLDRAMQGQQLTTAQTDQLSSLIAGVLFAGGSTTAASGAANEQRQAEQR